MKKINKYTLDLTNCDTCIEIIAAIDADLNARKQLVNTKKNIFKRVFGL